MTAVIFPLSLHAAIKLCYPHTTGFQVVPGAESVRVSFVDGTKTIHPTALFDILEKELRVQPNDINGVGTPEGRQVLVYVREGSNEYFSTRSADDLSTMMRPYSGPADPKQYDHTTPCTSMLIDDGAVFVRFYKAGEVCYCLSHSLLAPGFKGVLNAQRKGETVTVMGVEE